MPPTEALEPVAGDAPALSAPAPRPLGGLVVALALLLVAFAPVLVRTAQRWAEDPEYSHGFLMPVVAGWLLWEGRGRLRALRGGTSLLAPVVLLLCLLIAAVGEFHFVTSLGPFAFVGALGAVVLAFLGWPGLAAVLPALVVLALACPLPGRVEAALTLPLKGASTQFAVGLLHLSGIPTFLDGNLIHLQGADSLWVADACSGIRSFISLLSVAIVACLVWRRSWWLKTAVVLAAIPIAVFVNGFRIWLTGWLSVKVGPEAASGVFHFFEGFALFALAGLLLLGVAAVLGFLFPRGVGS